MALISQSRFFGASLNSRFLQGLRHIRAIVFSPSSPNLYHPALVPRQVSAYKFENDLSCPLNNR